MAWQLIYTSAPRLLEAGRTGFGTVARHRAVSGMLSSSVERFSQFARLPGHDPRRIVQTYRILTVGSGTYHVFSCLQDAGSDYTGRTNHIAHHLIAEPAEVRALSAAGTTPADVLLAMKWRSTWSEGPRYLDPAEEVDLSTLTASATHQWAAATGNPANARLLWNREALRGCYLIVPNGASALELFRESLQEAPEEAWQTTFTTCLEPNDDVADFRWVALPPASPLRGQVETSSRLVLDLTHPHTLPAPPKLEMPAPVAETARPAPEPAVPAREPPKERLRPVNAHPPVSTMGEWSPDLRPSTAKSSQSVIIISLLIAAMLIVVVLGGLFWQYNRQKQDRADYDQQIATTWKNYRLALADTRRWLEDQSDLNQGKALLQPHVAFFQSMQPLLNKPDQPVRLSLPAESTEELGDLKKLLEEWAALHASPWAKLKAGHETLTASVIQTEYRRWLGKRADTWKRLSEFFEQSALPLPADDIVLTLRSQAKEVLRLAEPERGAQTDWQLLFARLDQQIQKPDPEVLQWLKLWADLDGPLASAAASTAAADKSLPEWLRSKAALLKQMNEKDHGQPMAGEDKPGSAPQEKTPQKQTSAIEDADAPAARNDLYIHLLRPDEDLAGKLPELPVAADMQLYVGGAWDAHPIPDGKTEDKSGDLKKWMSVSLDDTKEIKFGPKLISNLTEMILFSDDGKLISIPDEHRKSSAGLRIVARSKDAMRVLFDLRLIPAGKFSGKPVLANVIESSVDNTGRTTLHMPAGFLKRLHLTQQPNPAHSLRRNGTASEQKIYALKPSGDSSFEVMPPQAQPSIGSGLPEIRRQISELEAGMKKDDDYLAAIDEKLPDHIKEQKRQSYIKAKSDKEIKLNTLRAQLLDLERAPTPMHFDLAPGHYTLILEQPDKLELCTLHVVPASQPPNSKP